MAEICNVALLGQKFMGRPHSIAYLKAGRFFNLPLVPKMYTVAGRDLIALAPFADRWGWENYSTNWKDVVKDPEVHLVDIATAPYMHADQALAAIAAGKIVACEVPLAGTLKEARQMKNAAVRSRRAQTFVWFPYRRYPAVVLAYRMIQSGRLGRLYHFRANFLESWAGPQTPLTWRFQKKYAGMGAHGDLNTHIVDLVRFLAGQEVVEVTGSVAETFVPSRDVPAATAAKGRRPARKPSGKSDVDDAVVFLARLAGGAVGTFESSRLATGHNSTLSIEMNGEHGAFRLGLDDLNTLWYFDNREDPQIAGWRKINVTRPADHPYMGAWWPEGRGLGYEHAYVHAVADMMTVLGEEEPTVPIPDFAEAYETHRVLEAALIAAKNRAAVKLSEIK